jgi:hypothetical protein
MAESKLQQMKAGLSEQVSVLANIESWVPMVTKWPWRGAQKTMGAQ